MDRYEASPCDHFPVDVRFSCSDMEEDRGHLGVRDRGHGAGDLI
jgi:hypothetical protein